MTEMAYLALRIRFIKEVSQSEPPPSKVNDLIGCLELTENENELIQNLIKRRTANKNDLFESIPYFEALIDQALNTDCPED